MSRPQHRRAIRSARSGLALLLTLCIAAISPGAELGVSVIDNEVSRKRDWAAGSFGQNLSATNLVTLNTRPVDGDELSDEPSTVEIKASDLAWVLQEPPSKALHAWRGPQPAGKRLYVKVIGEFAKQKGKSGKATAPKDPATWASNSLDVDLDVGATPKDNTPDEDNAEMDARNFVIPRNEVADVTLRALPPQCSEKRQELKPRAWVERAHDGVDLLDNGTSIFDGKSLTSRDLTDRVLANDLALTAKGLVRGTCVCVARLTFVDPSSGYPREFIDPIRVTVDGKVRCDIDVDYDRDGAVENVEDDPNEDAPIDFLADTGALVLVNCDSDIGTAETRDMDDFLVNGADDKLDMSPLSLELLEDLANDEHLYLVIQNADRSGKPWAMVHDPQRADGQHAIVGPAAPPATEAQMDNINIGGAEVWYPDGKARRYDSRFLVEGHYFAKEVLISLEIRKGAEVLERDTVRVLNCPWLANNNTQPLASKAAWQIPGNLINSQSYQFDGDHGAERVPAGAALEFVQDSAEWGFQVRRHNPVASARTMITALRMSMRADYEDRHPLKRFLSSKVGVYGYRDDDEKYVSPEHGGDQGGNLECLPPPIGEPFGRIMHGDTMSPVLRKFLADQKVQVQGGAVSLSISALGLVHIDEVACVLGSGKVVTPDWELAKELMKKSLRRQHGEHQILVGPTGPTYGDILAYLATKETGKPHDTKFKEGLSTIQSQLKGAGATVVPMPGMFFHYNDGRLRSVPRNIANIQPTTRDAAVVATPRNDPVPRNPDGVPSIFLTAWTQFRGILPVKIAAENYDRLTEAWRNGGEAHCASNTVREPIVW